MDIINNSISLDTIGGGLSALSRQFLTFGGVNESGSIPAWAPSGDFKLEFDLATTGNTKSIVSGFTDNDNKWNVFVTASGMVQYSSKVLAVSTDKIGTNAINDGKLNSGFVSRVGTTLTIDVNGLQDTFTVPVDVFTLDSASVQNGALFFSGVISNLRLTEAGGDNRFYPMKSVSLTTEQNALNPGVNDMTLNNIVSTDWEKFTQVGADWLGGELWTAGDISFDGLEPAFTDKATDFVVVGNTYVYSLSASNTNGLIISGSLGGSTFFNVTTDGDKSITGPASSINTLLRNEQVGATADCTNISLKRILEAP